MHLFGAVMLNKCYMFKLLGSLEGFGGEEMLDFSMQLGAKFKTLMKKIIGETLHFIHFHNT